jgi:hypothetical protein
MRTLGALLFCVGIDALSVPGQPPSARTACRRATAPVMLDGDTAVGVGLLFGGTALGAGLIAFIEKQNERTNERGGVSDETRSRMPIQALIVTRQGWSHTLISECTRTHHPLNRSRMAGKFMEDEVLVTDYGDKISQMEAAMAEAEGREVVDGDGLTAKEKEALRISDGWDQ